MRRFLLVSLLAMILFPMMAEDVAYATLADGVLILKYGEKPTEGTVYDVPKGATSTSAIPWYSSASTIQSVVIDPSFAQVSGIRSLAFWFRNCNNAKSITGLTYIDTKDVLYFDQMFQTCRELKSVDMTGWNTQSLTSMNSMFYNCLALEEAKGLEGFNTGNVDDMGLMFYNCQSLKAIPVGNWNTDKVADMEWMFYNCYEVEELDVAHFNMSKIIKIDNLFQGCKKLKSLDVSQWVTEQMTYFQETFKNCESLTSLDLSGWTTPNLLTTSLMFQNCSSLTEIKGMENWDLGNVVIANEMFERCSSLTTLDLSNVNMANGKMRNIASMFNGCTNLRTIYCDYDWSSVSGSNMFKGCENLMGGNGTAFDAEKAGNEYARPDATDTPGYFSHKSTTGIGGIRVERAAGPVYDLNGRYMGTDVNGLPAGLYLQGGKKVIVR